MPAEKGQKLARGRRSLARLRRINGTFEDAAGQKKTWKFSGETVAEKVGF
jgi:hypothetical protein